MDNKDQKQKLIDEFFELSKGKTTEEVLPLILAISSKAQRLGIELSNEEARQMIDRLLHF